MIQYILIRVCVLQRLKVLCKFTCSPLVTSVWQSSPPFLYGLIWHPVTVDQWEYFYTVFLHNLHGAWHLWPQFSMTMEIPVQVRTLLQSSLKDSCWKLTQFPIFSLLRLRSFSFLLQGLNLLISSAAHSYSMKSN